MVLPPLEFLKLILIFMVVLVAIVDCELKKYYINISRGKIGQTRSRKTAGGASLSQVGKGVPGIRKCPIDPGKQPGSPAVVYILNP